MFLTIKKKWIIIFLCVILILSSVIIFAAVRPAYQPNLKPVIVIDAGHGGIDGGSVGFSGTTERVINLDYAKTLKSYFETYGFKVVMTRENLDGLYSPYSTNKKKDDMLKRKEIIEGSHADLVISIHMNSFPLESCRGAQVFFNPDSEVSKNLAFSIQEMLVKNIPHARENADKGDYYLLNCSDVPSVIVECGFISNPEEESNLLNKDYREKLCYSIMCGVIKYFSSDGELKT